MVLCVRLTWLFLLIWVYQSWVLVSNLFTTADAFLQIVVVHRKNFAVRHWRTWVLEDIQVHPYRWLNPDLVAPALFVCCDHGQTPCRPFCRAGRGSVDL